MAIEDAVSSHRFKIGGQTRQFTGQSLVLGNSLPNFWFHTTTAYDILRQWGVEVGKRDFMGTPPKS